MQLLEELFTLEGIFFNPESTEDIGLAMDDVTIRMTSLLQARVESTEEVKSYFSYVLLILIHRPLTYRCSVITCFRSSGRRARSWPKWRLN